MYLEVHYSQYIKALGPLNAYWTFSYENHHQKIKLDVEKRSKNVSVTSFNLNYLFIETLYNQLACRKLIIRV
jgi:hypothetical protein